MFKDFMERVREINEKYKTPKIQMTPMVRMSLLSLRIYLVFLILILVYKFILIARGG